MSLIQVLEANTVFQDSLYKKIIPVISTLGTFNHWDRVFGCGVEEVWGSMYSQNFNIALLPMHDHFNLQQASTAMQSPGAR
jgi:hypothetical protein